MMQILIINNLNLYFYVNLIIFNSQAPKSMKTITIAAWYLTVAMGNLIVIIVAKLNPFNNQV